MADFCKQCAGDKFDMPSDFKGWQTPEQAAKGLNYLTVLCEGCGPIQVDPEGRCVSEDCLEKGHGEVPA